MSSKPKLSIKDLIAKVGDFGRRLRPYSLLIFLVFVALLYAFVFFRVNSLSSVQPTPDAVSSRVKAAKLPHIDQSVVNQLNSLQDNSVNVQALFSQARNNPFQ